MNASLRWRMRNNSVKKKNISHLRVTLEHKGYFCRGLCRTSHFYLGLQGRGRNKHDRRRSYEMTFIFDRLLRPSIIPIRTCRLNIQEGDPCAPQPRSAPRVTIRIHWHHLICPKFFRPQRTCLLKCLTTIISTSRPSWRRPTLRHRFCRAIDHFIRYLEEHFQLLVLSFLFYYSMLLCRHLVSVFSTHFHLSASRGFPGGPHSGRTVFLLRLLAAHLSHERRGATRSMKNYPRHLWIMTLNVVFLLC